MHINIYLTDEEFKKTIEICSKLKEKNLGGCSNNRILRAAIVGFLSKSIEAQTNIVRKFVQDDISARNKRKRDRDLGNCSS